MAVCEVCGNDYDKAFEVVAAGYRHVFDCFECAIQKMAPICQRCSCRGCRPRRRGQRSLLLLRPLRQGG